MYAACGGGPCPYKATVFEKEGLPLAAAAAAAEVAAGRDIAAAQERAAGRLSWLLLLLMLQWVLLVALQLKTSTSIRCP